MLTISLKYARTPKLKEIIAIYKIFSHVLSDESFPCVKKFL